MAKKNDDGNRSYTNGEITVFWKPALCIHSGICINDLPKVFNVFEKPWVDMKGASTDDIIDVVDSCPSKALYYEYNNAKKEVVFPEIKSNDVLVTMMKNGPAIIKSDCRIIDENGKEHKVKGVAAICRCGKTKKDPFCDGAHKR